MYLSCISVCVIRGSRTPGPEVRVRCFSVVRCDLDSQLFDIKTAPDCCLGIGLSYTIPRTEECVNCVGEYIAGIPVVESCCVAEKFYMAALPVCICMHEYTQI